MVLARIREFTKRHPRITYIAYLTVIVVVGLELALRVIVDFNPSYYMGYAKLRPGAVIPYPYGVIRFNQDGFPDDEFSAEKTKPRVAYIGDSVCYGVGAGAGYRVSELLEEAFPEFEHMNMAFGVGAGISQKSVRTILASHEKFDIDMFVYLMNLNDILPDRDDKEKVVDKKLRFRRALEWLRGPSYLYTYVRLIVKNYYVRKGIGITMQRQYEMSPSESQAVFDATCERIRKLKIEMDRRGVELAVVIVPYEMQVSEDAERVYREAGVSWGDDFLDRGPQNALVERLGGVEVFDAYEAFVSPALHTDRTTYQVGECFVYNKGDKLDWNHPNRKGHRLISDFLQRAELFDLLDAGEAIDEAAAPAELQTE